MRPGVPGPLQLNPDKVRLMSAWIGKYGKMPRIGQMYPKASQGGLGGPMGGRPMGLGSGMPKLDLRGGMR